MSVAVQGFSLLRQVWFVIHGIAEMVFLAYLLWPHYCCEIFSTRVDLDLTRGAFSV